MVLQNTTLSSFNMRKEKFAPEGGDRDGGPPQVPARGRYVNTNIRWLFCVWFCPTKCQGIILLWHCFTIVYKQKKNLCKTTIYNHAKALTHLQCQPSFSNYTSHTVFNVTSTLQFFFLFFYCEHVLHSLRELVVGGYCYSGVEYTARMTSDAITCSYCTFTFCN